MQAEDFEDLYKLSPVQQDKLADALSAESPGFQVRQAVYTVHGQLDHSSFKHAWQQAISDHAVLRTAFHWEGLEKPIQIVDRRGRFALNEQDWRSFSADDQQQRVRAFLRDDRQLGFDLNRAPLMRMSLLRMSDEVYQLIWSYHGLVLDETSVALVLNEVTEFYGCLRRGENCFTKKPHGSFREHISWLRQQDISAADLFWQKTLTGCEGPSRLDGFHELAASESIHKEQTTQLSVATSSALQSLARQYHLSGISLLLGAWALLLCRYNDEEDAVFGIMFSGRPLSLSGVESIVGPFSNTLPACVRVFPKEPLLSWLSKLNNWYLEARQCQHVGLKDIEARSKVPPGQALFESVVSEVCAAETFSFLPETDLIIDRDDSFRGQDSPLVITAPDGPQISLCISYDGGRFEDAFIGRILEQLRMLLEKMIAEPTQRLADISLLTPAEREQLLVDVDTSPRTDSSIRCVHELFEAQAELTPNSSAVAFAGESLSYYQLNERANQLAHHLRSLGVRTEVPVGVLIHRSLDTLVALLGVLKAGGVYLPLDPQLPSERLAFMLGETGTRVLLTHQDLLFTQPFVAAAEELVCLDLEWERIAEQSSENLERPSSTTHLAYIIYTSGSTGQPKGVCISHEAASVHLPSIKEAFGLNAADRVLQFASLSFDVSLEQILAPLLAGATVVLRPAEVWSADQFWEQVVEHQLTVANLPPAYWNQVTQELPEVELQNVIAQARRVLRLMVVGGDVIPPEAVRRWQRSPFKEVRLLNAYGPTETTITSALHEVPAIKAEDEREALRRVPIGRGVGERRLYVLDREGQLVTVGGRGELHIAGLELARGYFNDAVLTAERFMPNPFSDEPGGRMYRTGDVVRRLSSGELDYLGRRDEQVKLRGYRVELGDVEAALGTERGVKECAVALKGLENGEKRLVGYVVKEVGEKVSALDMRARLKERLPEYMIPAVIVELEKLPLMASGKLDRRALPLPEQHPPELEESFVEAHNDIQKRLVEIWADLLGIARIGVSDNFFEVGGDSLLATQLISRVQKSFQTEISLRTLFDEPTIAGLARNLETSRPADHANIPTIERTTRKATLPLSFAQERLWFMSQLQPDSPLFNITTAVRLNGALDLRALEETFSEIIRRHEALRTTFRVVEDAPVELIHPAQKIAIPVVDLSGLAEAERGAEVSCLVREEARHSFDLQELPLLRVSVIRLGLEEHVLLLTMHHIVSDGWSVGVMVREVAALYAAYSAGNPSPLLELPVQYADFASWQRGWMAGEVLENQLDYWRRRLAGNLPKLLMPTDHARPSKPSFRGTTCVYAISKSSSERLKELSRREGTTLFMTLMAAFQTLLHRYSGQDDIIIGTDIANRNQSEIEGLIGFFVNLVPIRTNLAGNPTFREYLQQVKDVALGAYSHQDLPFARLVNEVQPERDPNQAPLFQTLFVMQNAPVPPMELAGLQLSQMEIDEGVAKFDLAVFMEETEQGLIGRWNFSTEIFESTTIDRMAAHFERLLESIATQPGAKLSRLEMLIEAEKSHQALDSKQQQEFKLSRLRKASRKPVQRVKVIVNTGYLPQCPGMPLVIEPAMEDVDLAQWAGHNLAFIESQLFKHGAMLFRNFPIESVSQFEHCASTICADLFSEYGDLPREKMGGKVYGSTPYPSNQTILFHNESSHQHRWPMKIWFYCLKQATTGGETPIADCRRVYDLLSPATRDCFAKKGIMYVRNYTEGLDVSWADFFHTTCKGDVEKQCYESGIEWQWQSNNGLQTRKTTVAVAGHPKTGEMLFFNQLQLHHSSCLEPDVRVSLFNMFGEERLPRNVYYRDGTRIGDKVMAEVGEAYKKVAVSFAWQEGDILMLDNMLVAHGRYPFEGERKIVVALGEMLGEKDLHESFARQVHA